MDAKIKEIVEEIEAARASHKATYENYNPLGGEDKIEVARDTLIVAYERHWPTLRAALAPQGPPKMVRIQPAPSERDTETIAATPAMWALAGPPPSAPPSPAPSAPAPEEQIAPHWIELASVDRKCSVCGRYYLKGNADRQKTHELKCWFGISAERVAQSKAELARGEYVGIEGLAQDAPAPDAAARYERFRVGFDFYRTVNGWIARQVTNADAKRVPDAWVTFDIELPPDVPPTGVSVHAAAVSLLSAAQARVVELEAERDAERAARERAERERKELFEQLHEWSEDRALDGLRAKLSAAESARDAAVRERDQTTLHMHRMLALVGRALEGHHVSRDFGGNAPEDVQGLLDAAFVLHDRLSAALSRAQAAEERAARLSKIIHDAYGFLPSTGQALAFVDDDLVPHVVAVADEFAVLREQRDALQRGLAAAEERAEKAERERDIEHTAKQRWQVRVDEVESALARCGEALRPFAEYADAIPGGLPDRDTVVVWKWVAVCVGDFRRARAALPDKRGESGEIDNTNAPTARKD